MSLPRILTICGQFMRWAAAACPIVCLWCVTCVCEFANLMFVYDAHFNSSPPIDQYDHGYALLSCKLPSS